MKAFLIVICATMVQLSAKAQVQQVPDIKPIINNKTVTGDLTFHIPAFKVIKTHDKEFSIDSLTWKSVKQEWISSSKIRSGPAVLEKYGSAAAKGVMVVTIDDDEYPDAFEALSNGLKELKFNQ